MIVLQNNDPEWALPYGMMVHRLDDVHCRLLLRSHGTPQTVSEKFLWMARLGNEPLEIGERECLYLEDFPIPIPAQLEIAKEVSRLATSWYSQQSWQNLNLKLYDHGVSLGEIVEWEMTYFFYELAKFIERTKLLLQEKKPKQILALGEPSYLKILQDLAEQSGIPFKAHPAPFLPWVQKQLWRRWGTPHFLTRYPETGNEKAPVEPSDVLFLVANAGTGKIASACVPLLEQNQVRVRLLGYSTGATFLRSHGLPFRGFQDYFPFPSSPGWPRYQKFRNLWPQVQHLLQSASPSYHDISLRPFFEKKLRQLLWTRFPEISHAISLLDRILEVEKPSLVVSGFDPFWLDLILIRLAELRGGRGMRVQIGTYFDYLCPPLKATYLAAQGVRTKNLYLRQGVAANRMEIVGQPKYDFLKKPHWKAPSREELGIVPNQKVLIYATEPGNIVGSKREKAVHEDALMRFAENHQNVALLIKLHPSDSGQQTYHILHHHRCQNVKILRDADPYGLMALCDAWITMYSTTAIEALLFGKPVILMNFFQKDYYPELVQEGLATYAERYEGLEARFSWAAEASQSDEFRQRARKFIEEEFFKFDGNSAERISNFILAKKSHGYSSNPS